MPTLTVEDRAVITPEMRAEVERIMPWLGKLVWARTARQVRNDIFVTAFIISKIRVSSRGRVYCEVFIMEAPRRRQYFDHQKWQRISAVDVSSYEFSEYDESLGELGPGL